VIYSHNNWYIKQGQANPSIYEQPHILDVERVPAMDCRSLSELSQFNEPEYDGLTQLVIPMDSWLGFFTPEY